MVVVAWAQANTFQWTVTNVGVNNTDSNLYPVTPTSTATWYGSVEWTPETISQHSNNGQAGKFRATSGKATGTTGISVYTSPDPTKAVFFLIMMPYGTGEVNQTKVSIPPLRTCGLSLFDNVTSNQVGFIDVTSHVDKAQVERLWDDSQFGTNSSYSFKQADQDVKLYVSFLQHLMPFNEDVL